MEVNGGKRRPRVAVFMPFIKGDLTQRTFFSTARDSFDLVVYASEAHPEVPDDIEWRRVPAARIRRPRLSWATFSSSVALIRLSLRADLIHTWAPFPVLPGRVDLATVNFCHAAFHEATGGQALNGKPRSWSAARRLTTGLEHRRYADGGVRMLAAMSSSGKRDLERHYPGVPVALTPRGVDTKRFRPNRESRLQLRGELGIRGDEVVMVYVAADSSTLKGLEVLVRSMGYLQARGNEPPLLLIAGRGHGWARPLATDLGIGERVRVLGFRNDVERLYQAADMLVLPTLYETFCRVAYEAAASGLPVVAPRDVGGVDDIVGDDQAGLLTDRSPESVARAIERLVADPELRSELGEEGRRRALEHSPKAFTERTIECYERLLSSPSP